MISRSLLQGATPRNTMAFSDRELDYGWNVLEIVNLARLRFRMFAGGGIGEYMNFRQ